jgi:hypothetical protein
MAFYDLSKNERDILAHEMRNHLLEDIMKRQTIYHREYFADDDTYVRKTAYLAVGKIYSSGDASLKAILLPLGPLFKEPEFKIRQTVVNAAGEIGKWEFDTVQYFFDTALFDKHHAVRNAVIGSIKKMGEKNPEPVLAWSRKYLHHEDKEIRREICHGIELRGRTYPQDILPLLRELEFDKTARVKNTLVHVLGQIAYKSGCLETVIADLNTWQNRELVEKAVDEIIDVHHRYRDFAVLTQQQAIEYINRHYIK